MPRKPKCEPWKNVVVIGEPSKELIRKVIRGFIEKHPEWFCQNETEEEENNNKPETNSEARHAMFVLDRIEDGFAVIEHESSTFNVPISLLPKGAREGDILRFRIEIDTSATDKRRKKMSDLLQFDE